MSQTCRRPWLTFSASRPSQQCFSALLGLGLLVVGDAVAPEVLDRRGVLAAELALLAQRPQQADEKLLLIERLAGDTRWGGHTLEG